MPLEHSPWSDTAHQPASDSSSFRADPSDFHARFSRSSEAAERRRFIQQRLDQIDDALDRGGLSPEAERALEHESRQLEGEHRTLSQKPHDQRALDQAFGRELLQPAVEHVERAAQAAWNNAQTEVAGLASRFAGMIGRLFKHVTDTAARALGGSMRRGLQSFDTTVKTMNSLHDEAELVPERLSQAWDVTKDVAGDVAKKGAFIGGAVLTAPVWVPAAGVYLGGQWMARKGAELIREGKAYVGRQLEDIQVSMDQAMRGLEGQVQNNLRDFVYSLHRAKQDVQNAYNQLAREALEDQWRGRSAYDPGVQARQAELQRLWQENLRQQELLQRALRGTPIHPSAPTAFNNSSWPPAYQPWGNN